MTTKCAKGMSLIEILGVVTITMTVASVAIISAKDSLQAGQRSAVQRELQSLNTVLNNYKAAGGVIEPGTSAEGVIDLLKRGVRMGAADYAPLVDDPDLTKRIGDKDYTLTYDDTAGFSYVPDGGGEEFVQAGAEVTGIERLQDGYPFDPSNSDAAQTALTELQNTNPNDPAYGNLLEALNAAYAMETLTDADMLAAGLVSYNGTWMRPEVAQLNYAEDAREALDAGGTWESLSSDQQRAFANIYSQNAVELGKSSALNLMNPSVLTKELVAGYGNINGTWTTPKATSSGSTSIVGATMPMPSGSDKRYNVYAIVDPLQPAILIGSMHDVPVLFNGQTGGYYKFTTHLAPMDDLGNGWVTPMATANQQGVAYLPDGSVLGYSPAFSHALAINSLAGGTGQIQYVDSN